MAQRDEGEGSRPAAGARDKHTKHFVRTGRARKTARKAAPAGAGLRAAEIKGEAAARGADPKPDPDLD